MSNPSSPASADPLRPFLVIPAGGRGMRMGGGLPKQFRDWDGRPLLQVTVEAFLAPGMPRLAGIALAVPESHMEEARSWSFQVPCTVVQGGETRQESVWLALRALPDQPLAPVMIHDAVRPFPPAAPLWEALEALNRFDGVLLGEPSTDTLKRVDPLGRVLRTEPREEFYRAQTPQIARLGTWLHAFDAAHEAGYAATDDAALLERLGLAVKLIPSPSSNLKLTTPEDWERARRH
ncbi:MAG: 2-C-methyl-D-erythritol 4-phosphate cytidylyltransferase [Geothrix sp.]|uniref:2-C-methyl-D-erythritol 4-phosphate cytidylyltransferase n=1 Tax=Geothrix sp. TaxID=1962974 RepID=UPI00182E8911|nr:2-C-methyl-D-erythritol 4-phosphate cytidylyltransferase [Geothrix sp.]NWJ39387.1 2-C-methyl-D-erythritol 4-phosphate cytidylyltransferase [Geothrix sp.]WIL19388.1 MAG: 2-C-methyl-D-erythritol 4-phosphate cytidylyltransferase [Geothrix sp.]